MKIKNLKKTQLTILVGGNYIGIGSGKTSPDMFLKKDDIRNIVSTMSPEEVQLIITNSDAEIEMLAELGVSPEFTIDKSNQNEENNDTEK